MHILILGGTGFIGHQIVKKLLASGHEVNLLCRNPEKATQIFGEKANYFKGDLSDIEKINFKEILTNIDLMLYCVGTDERDIPTEDPYTFFHKGNVKNCKEVLETAKNLGVKRVIVLGSMFTYIDRTFPELKLSSYHPYIRSRKEQQTEIMAMSNDNFIVNLVEIPFVFGHTPGHNSLWEALVNYIRVVNPLIVTPGGANCISVKSVADAVIGVINHVNESCSIPIGDENLTWVDILDRINAKANKSRKKIHLLKKGVFSDLTRLGAYFHEFFGMKSGLNQKYISELINLEAFYDTADVKKRLHYTGGDLDEAFAETVMACPKTHLVGSLQRSVDWFNDSTRQTLKTLKQLHKMTTPKK